MWQVACLVMPAVLAATWKALWMALSWMWWRRLTPVRGSRQSFRGRRRIEDAPTQSGDALPEIEDALVRIQSVLAQRRSALPQNEDASLQLQSAAVQIDDATPQIQRDTRQNEDALGQIEVASGQIERDRWQIECAAGQIGDVRFPKGDVLVPIDVKALR